MQRQIASLVRRARKASSLLWLLIASPALAQAPPPIPVIADADRIASFNISSSTSQVSVGFPVFGDCTDLQVTIAGTVQPLASGLWNCASLSGFALNTLPLPITDMVVNFTPALTTGTLVIQGAWHPRNLAVPTASGINRREYEQTYSTLVAGQRELFHNINSLFAVGNVPVITNQGANSFYSGPTSGAPALPSFRAMVQGDLPAGLGVNESANTFFAGPASGGAALPAFRAFSFNDLGTQSANTVLAGPTTGGAVAPTFRALVAADIPLTSAHWTRQFPTTTYTPHANLLKALVTCVGGGGGGGGAVNSANQAAGGGGQAGGFSRVLLTAAQIGASQTVTIGAAGAAGANTGATAGTGGATSLGSFCVANGGIGGSGSAGNTASNGGSGQSVGTGDETYIGEEGFPGGGGTITTIISGSGSGGNGPWGGGARGTVVQGNGRAGNSCGAGGSGGLSISSGGAVTGGAGAAGCVIVDELNLQ